MTYATLEDLTAPAAPPTVRFSPADSAGPRSQAAPRVAIVIPCYRVARHLESLIASIPSRWAHIICVDDASPDDTGLVLARLTDARVTVLRHTVNQGVGGALKTGYAHALAIGADIIVKMDGDGQMAPSDLDTLIAPLLAGVADYAKGNRFVDLRALRRMPTLRLLGNGALSFASKAASGYWNMLDVNNGYTAITRDALERLDLAHVADRYFFETSMLIELYLANARVADVALPARYADEKSSLRISRVLLTFPPMLVRGLARRFYWRYLIEDFGLASLCALAGVPLTLFGIVFGGLRWYMSVQSGVAASSGTVLLAALPIILGFQLLLTTALLDVLSARTVKWGGRADTLKHVPADGPGARLLTHETDAEPLGARVG